MAREFFKNLPDTTTPLNAQRMNNFLNGEEAMGSIVVDDIVCKNICSGINQNYFINAGATTVGYSVGDSGLTIPVDDGYYTISTITSQIRYRIGCTNTLPTDDVGVTLYNGVNKDGTSESITIDTTGYTYLIINATDLTKIQIEKGSVATDYVEHKEFSNKQIYSTSEQVIGTWFGKLLYCKTIELGTLPNNGKIQYTTGISSSCTIVKIDTLAINPTDNSTIPINYYNTTLAMWWYTLVDDNKHLFVVTNNGNISTHKGIITIYYTKD